MSTQAQTEDSSTDRSIINNPFEKPTRYWRLDPNTQRRTDELVEGRRDSGDYMPVPKEGPDGLPFREIKSANIPPHSQINEIRDCVDAWRESGWQGASKATRDLLDYWSGSEIEPRPFFCQREAIETVVWLNEAGKVFDRKKWKKIVGALKEINAKFNEELPRQALKMATGTGKTKLMEMLISWLAVNRPKGADVLVIAPGLTVKERLQELDPASHPETYKNLLPRHLQEKIGRIRVTILNFHVFRKRSTLYVDGIDDTLSGTGKKLIKRGTAKDPERWKETDQEMLDRILRSHRKRKLFVFNDEAHHCYLPSKRPSENADSEEREYEEDAALWFNALRSLKKMKRLEQVFDLSATPMYLRPRAELPFSVLFPWTITDYPLIEAVEAGLTKIPKVPVDDDSDNKKPLYRNIYENTTPKNIDINNVQSTITSLLEQMHEHYRNKTNPAYLKAEIIPVMIVVANSIANATALFGHIAGHYNQKNSIWVQGAYEMFSNIRPDGSGPVNRPPSLLVHSGLDRLEDLPESLKNVLAEQAKLHAPDANTKKEKLQKIRDIFNSVGKRGQPGEHIRCIVSVSMLTEGWDARTVTHIFGYRKFGTQLLCEQMAGRGLRRTNFESADGTGKLQPEIVEIFGIPFNFMRAEGDIDPIAPTEPYHVYSVPERESRRIAFPNIVSYRLEPPQEEMILDPTKVSNYEVTATRIPSMTEIMDIMGGERITELTEKRRKHLVYKTAAKVVANFDIEEPQRRQLFKSAVTAVEDWLAHPKIKCIDRRQLLVEPHNEVVPREIAKCCIKAKGGKLRIFPIFADERGSEPRILDTGDVDFWTSRRLFHDTQHSELNRAPCDSGSEVRVAQVLDELDGIKAWARNFRLGWQIPYLDQRTGIWRNYIPDFVARIGNLDDPIYLVIEYKGQPGADSDMKTKGIIDWWLPAVNGSDDPACHGEWRYVFIESEDEVRPTLMKEINS